MELNVQPLHPDVGVALPSPAPKKAHFRDDTTHDDARHVFMRAAWVFAALRRPHWRLATCVCRWLSCFLACALSPLLASRASPGLFPVYGDIVGVFMSDPSPWKVALHVGILVVAAVFMRLVVYPLWFQDKWNWRHQVQLARQTFTRLSHDTGHRSASRRLDATAVSIGLKIQRPRRIEEDSEPEKPVIHLRIHSAPRAQGSWTLMALGTPLLWVAVVTIVRSIARGTQYEDLVAATGIANVPQWQVQLFLFDVLMVLHATSLLLTLDEICQTLDRTPTIITSGLRILLCWSLAALLLLASLYYEAFSALLQSSLVSWAVQSADESTSWLLVTLTSESWRCVLSSVVVVLDIVWVIQDVCFPGFGTRVGAKLYGLPWDYVSISLVLGGKRIYFTSKWLSSFLVIGVLLPLDSCYFFQELTYSLSKFSQVADPKASYRVFPTLQTSESVGNEPLGIQALMKRGSLARFLSQSRLDRIPAVLCIFMAVWLLCWLWRREGWRISYSLFLGRPSHVDQERQTLKLNASVPSSTRSALKDQLRLYGLYKVRSQFDLLGSCLAAVSVFVVVLQIRSIWRSGDTRAGETYGVLLIVLSSVSIYQLYNRYALKYQVLVLRKQIARVHSRPWWHGTPKSLLLAPFLLEVVLSSLCVPPFIHGRLHFDEDRFVVTKSPVLASQHLSCPPNMVPKRDGIDESLSGVCELQYSYPVEVLNLVVLLRLYWFVRLLRNELFRRLFAEHSALLVTAGIAARNLPNEMSSLRWSFRMCLSQIPGRVIFGIFVFLWVGTSAAVSILERPFPSLLDSEENSLWLTIVTISAVGYGDAYPLTAFGRVAIILGAVLGGALVVSLMTSIFLETLKGSKDEHNFVRSLERIAEEKKIQHASATLIVAAWRTYRERRQQNRNALPVENKKLFDLAHRFNADRKRSQPKETAENIEQTRVKTITQWRATQLTEWIETSTKHKHLRLEAIERHIDELEQVMQAVLAI